MVEYKLYGIGSDGHVLWRHDCFALDDLDSLDHARELGGIYEIEIWQGARFVARMTKDGTASLAQSSAQPAHAGPLRIAP